MTEIVPSGELGIIKVFLKYNGWVNRSRAAGSDHNIYRKVVFYEEESHSSFQHCHVRFGGDAVTLFGLGRNLLR